MRPIFALFLLIAMVSAAEESEADLAYKQGLSKLQESQTDHAALLPATRLFAKAASLYESAGNEAKVVEVNSCLYWARKKFTLADTNAAKLDATVTQRIEAAVREIPADQANEFLKRANEYAQSHADQPLLVAIRYFEVGDRFKETDAGRAAIDLSLKAMQKIGEQAKRETYKPAATDGKVFVKSEPVGAAILLVTAEGGKLETGKNTPSLIQLPVGYRTVELNLKGFKPAMLTVQVDAKVIAKPDAAKLEAVTVPVDVLFEDGWLVYANGSPARASGGGKAETPCTIELPMGTHQIAFAKEGFIDVSQKYDVKTLDDKLTLESKQKPIKGKSVLLSTPAAATGKDAPRVPGGKSLPVTIYANADDEALIFINGKQVLKAGFHSVPTMETEVSVGDVITVKLRDTGLGFGFACVFKLQSGLSLRSNQTDWQSYKPADESKWWQAPATGKKPDTGSSLRTAKSVSEKSEVDCVSIWPAGVGEMGTGYLFHVVTPASFKK
jgi:hypothetical protein